MKREFLDYIEDIIQAMTECSDFVGELSYEDFINDIKTVKAVIRNLEIIGEATGKIPEEIKQKYPEIEWNKIIGMRNKLIHEYFGVDNKIIWDTINNNIPASKPLFEKILEEYKE